MELLKLMLPPKRGSAAGTEQAADVASLPERKRKVRARLGRMSERIT